MRSQNKVRFATWLVTIFKRNVNNEILKTLTTSLSRLIQMFQDRELYVKNICFLRVSLFYCFFLFFRIIYTIYISNNLNLLRY